MRPKTRRRIDLICCLGIATCLLNFLGNRKQPPAQTQLNSASAAIAPGQQASLACHAVIGQIVAFARTASDDANSNRTDSLTAIGNCIDRQQHIDATQCPTDFRNAEGRFLAAERSLWQDARADRLSSPDVVTRAFFDVYSHRSPYDTLDRMSDKIKRDLDIFQSTTFDLITVSAKYGVN